MSSPYNDPASTDSLFTPIRHAIHVFCYLIVLASAALITLIGGMEVGKATTIASSTPERNGITGGLLSVVIFSAALSVEALITGVLEGGLSPSEASFAGRFSVWVLKALVEGFVVFAMLAEMWQVLGSRLGLKREAVVVEQQMSVDRSKDKPRARRSARKIA